MIEQSGSGKYVIHQEYLKDPVVKLHIPQVYVPSCENNHSQENMVDKEKANRVLNQLSRKKNNDKILERSRKQLEQCQIELAEVFSESERGTQPLNFRKANARRIILSKKLVSDIQRVNKQIADVIDNLIYQPADAMMEVQDSKIRKQQQLINATIVKDVHKSIHILNTLPVNSDPNTFRQKYDQFLKVQQVMINSQWDQKKELEDLLAERERVKERVEKEIKEFLKKSSHGSDANAHLEHINESVMKFFRLIFGTDYSMRLRSDRILASTDPEHLKRQFEMAHAKGKEENVDCLERKQKEKRERKVLNTNSSENEETDREKEHTGEQFKQQQGQQNKKVTLNSEKNIQLRLSGDFNKTENNKKDNNTLKESTLQQHQLDKSQVFNSVSDKNQIVEKDNNPQELTGNQKGKEHINEKVNKLLENKRKEARNTSRNQTTRASWSPGRKSASSSKNILRGNQQAVNGLSSTKSMNQSLLKSRELSQQTIKKSSSKIQKIKTEQFDPFEAENKLKRESLLASHIPSYQAKQLDILEHSFQKDVLQHLFDFFFNPISESVEYDFQEHNWDQLFNQFKNSKLSQPSAALATSSTTLLPPIKQSNVSKTDQANTSANHADQQQQHQQSEGSASEESVYSKEFYQYLREYQMVVAESKGCSREEKLFKIAEILAKSQKQLEFYEAQLELSEPQLRRHMSHQNTRLMQSPSLRLRSSNNPDQGSPSLLLSNSSNRDQLSQRDQQVQQQKSNLIVQTQTSNLGQQLEQAIPTLNISQSYQQSAQQQQHNSNTAYNSVSQFNPSLQLDKNNSSNSNRAPGQLLSPKKVAFQEQNERDDDGIEDTNKISDSIKEASKHKQIVKLPQLKKLKQSSRLAVNEKMDQYLEQVKSQETSEYMQQVQQLYKNCRIESFKTKKVHIESIRKNRQFAKNFNKIDKNLSYVLSL